MKNTLFIIITGLSGSGKSLTQKCFEDMGFFCVDNLPIPLFATFLELCARTGEEFRRVAVVSDIRERKFITEFPSVLKEVQATGYNIKLLFLEAGKETLIRRFSETRRPHPLGADKPLAAAVEEEQGLLRGIRDAADMVIDTTSLTVHELRQVLRDRFMAEEPKLAMGISVTSFGYKFGIPFDSDLLFDVRFLPNPFFVESIKRKTGLEPEVDTFLMNDPRTRDFLDHLFRFLDFVIPLYVREGKSYLKISVGCTGGRHRSPAVATRLREHLETQTYKVVATHRDIDRE